MYKHIQYVCLEENVTVEYCGTDSLWFVRPLVVEDDIASFANQLKVLIPAEASQSFITS